MTKSAQALIWSVESIQDGRFWTFTLPVEVPVKVGCAMWRRLAWELKRNLGFSGIRVFELHPNGHGLHVHVVSEKYHDVNAVRCISNKMGWGRINVVRVKNCNVVGFSRIGHLGKYLAKYLVKEIRKREWSLKGVRLWGSFGGFKHCKVSSVRVSTVIGRLMKLLPYHEIYKRYGDAINKSARHMNFYTLDFANAIYGGKWPEFDVFLQQAYNVSGVPF